jgi:hypothetical protein
VGKSCGPTFLASAACRLLVQEGRGDEALLLAWSDCSGRLIGDGQRWVKQWLAQSSEEHGRMGGRREKRSGLQLPQ